MNDERIDDRVIARMRSALDEVAAGVEDDGLIPVHPRREVPRRWLGIAAATALLVGGAGFAISRRSADDPTAAPTPPATAIADPTTTFPAEVAATSTTILDEPSPPWFTLEMPDFGRGLDAATKTPDVNRQFQKNNDNEQAQDRLTNDHADHRGVDVVA